MRSRPVAPAVIGALVLSIVAGASAVAGTEAAGWQSTVLSHTNRDEPRVVTLLPIKDNTLHESQDGGISNGAGAYLFVGNTNHGVIRRAVLEFDVAAAVPAGAEVDRVALTLSMSRTSSAAQAVRLFSLTDEWGEGDSNADRNEGSGAPAAADDATWLHTYYPDRRWSTPGGDFVDGASASATVAGMDRYEWSSERMEDDVERWLADPDANHGWILIGVERDGSGGKLRRTSKRFDSVDNADEEARPRLIVEYRLEDSTSTPETSTPETATPETETATPGTKTATPGTSTPGTSTPETATPDTATPGTPSPETETSTPGTTTPRQTPTPETAMPQTPTPETTSAPERWFAYLPLARNET